MGPRDLCLVQVKGLIELVEARIERSKNYRNLLGTFCFFMCYFAFLISLDKGAGSDITKRYEIESSIISSVVGALPEGTTVVTCSVSFLAHRPLAPLTAFLTPLSSPFPSLPLCPRPLSLSLSLSLSLPLSD